MSNFTNFMLGVSTTVFLASGGYTLVPREWYDPACQIKGNISINSEERIYHVPGQEFYSLTNIQYLRGERWFCTEEDACAAGWRKAYR